jgi:hypothetical protein
VKLIKYTDSTEQLNGSFSSNRASSFIKIIKFLFVIMLLFPAESLFCGTYLNKLNNLPTPDLSADIKSDLSTDASDRTSDQVKKKHIPLNFSFYAIYDFYSLLDSSGDIYSLENSIELNANLDIPVDFYAFSFCLNNTFYIDFNQFRTDKISEPINYSDVVRSGLYNMFTADIDNMLDFKNKIRLNFPFYFSIDTAVNDYMFFSFIPVCRLSGDYFFGFNWELEQTYIFEKFIYFPDTINDYFVNISSTYLKLAYEFFRFYGPKNFKWTISLENSIKFKFPSASAVTAEYDFTQFSNKTKFGAYFDFYGFRPSVYFIMNLFSNLDPLEVSNLYIGISTGLKYRIKWFSFSLNYKGTSDLLLNKLLNKFIWYSEIDFYVKFDFYKDLSRK